MENHFLGIIRGCLSEKTCLHSLGVGRTAERLARGQGLPGEKGFLAGILHDYAREMSDASLLKEAKRFHIPVDRVTLAHPILLHGPVGAALVQRELGIEDEDVLEAIYCHTFGREGMGPLARIVYAADIIEPSRNFPGVAQLREQVRADFPTGLRYVVESTINYVLRQGYLLHPSTVHFWNELVLEIDK